MKKHEPDYPLISIIIPNYNKGNYIAETIKSVTSQSYSNWEAIIVDDGSTDNSLEIVRYFSSLNSKIKLFVRNRLPKGGSTCRNIGLEYACGEFVIFFDSDDLMEPYCLEQRLNYFLNNKELDFAVFPVGTFFKIIGDSKSKWIPSKRNHLKKFLKHELPWNIMSPMWRTNFIKTSLQGFDEEFPRLQDIELHTRALMVKNVHYAISTNAQIDCYYRIDRSRNSFSNIETIKRMYKGIILYVQKFSLLTSKKNHSALCGTFFSFCSHLNYHRIIGDINPEEHKIILLELEIFMKDSNLFCKRQLIIFKLYNYLYMKNLWKIKGFNFFLKKIFMLKF